MLLCHMQVSMSVYILKNNYIIIGSVCVSCCAGMNELGLYNFFFFKVTGLLRV